MQRRTYLLRESNECLPPIHACQVASVHAWRTSEAVIQPEALYVAFSLLAQELFAQLVTAPRTGYGVQCQKRG